LIYVLALTTLITASAHAAQLADKETMRHQLESVGDVTYVAEHFFPYLLAHAEAQKLPSGVAIMFYLAKQDFIKFVLNGMPREGQAIILLSLDMKIPKYIRAILPDDVHEADEAVQAWESISR
jgi:hypothetical protein